MCVSVPKHTREKSGVMSNDIFKTADSEDLSLEGEWEYMIFAVMILVFEIAVFL